MEVEKMRVTSAGKENAGKRRLIYWLLVQSCSDGLCTQATQMLKCSIVGISSARHGNDFKRPTHIYQIGCIRYFFRVSREWPLLRPSLDL